jgi:hypothetical protein
VIVFSLIAKSQGCRHTHHKNHEIFLLSIFLLNYLRLYEISGSIFLLNYLRLFAICSDLWNEISGSIFSLNYLWLFAICYGLWYEISGSVDVGEFENDRSLGFLNGPSLNDQLYWNLYQILFWGDLTLYLVIFYCEKIICELRIPFAFEIRIESWMITVHLWIFKGNILKLSKNCLPFAFDLKFSFPHCIIHNIQYSMILV